MRSDADPENAHERLRREVAEIIAMLTDGELTAQHPFDLASSRALAANIDSGDIAEHLFECTAARGTSYRVLVEQVSDADTRMVLNTTVAGERLLIALLDALLDELDNRQHPSKGHLTGG